MIVLFTIGNHYSTLRFDDAVIKNEKRLSGMINVFKLKLRIENICVHGCLPMTDIFPLAEPSTALEGSASSNSLKKSVAAKRK